MRLWHLVVYILLGAGGSVCSGVLQLSSETFHAHLKANSLVLVTFCVPWYEPCQKLYPELEIAAEVLSPKEIFLVNINCTAEYKFCSEYNVTSYPALSVFRGVASITRFREKRKAKAIISYMLRQLLPKVSIVTEENIEELRSIDMPLAIIFVEESDHISREIFNVVSEEYQDQFLFGVSYDMNLSKDNSINPPSIVLRSPSDHIDRILSGTVAYSQIKHFLDNVSGPLIGKFSMETYYSYTQSELPRLHIFATTEQERQFLAEALQHVAAKHRDDMNFATIDAKKYGFFAEALSLTTGLFPALVIEDVMSGDTVPFDQSRDITADNAGKFVEEFFGARKTAKIDDKNGSHDEL